MKRLLVTGASGNLGRVLSGIAVNDFEVWSAYRTNPNVGGGQPVSLDLCDEAAVVKLVDSVRPDIIIHAAASERTQDMEHTNRLAALHILAAASRTNARLIALSTDLVFDGKCPLYKELHPPTPVSAYGRVKAENEQRFSAYDRALVVRTSLIYDRDPANYQSQWMREIRARGEQVPLFTDEIRQPILAADLARALIELAQGPLTGILNVAGPQRLTRWDFGSALLELMGYAPETAARKVLAAEVAPGRPRDCSLDLTKAQHHVTTRIAPLRDALGLA
jgi:dTDP-4-dehydrorhamnose reductase